MHAHQHSKLPLLLNFNSFRHQLQLMVFSNFVLEEKKWWWIIHQTLAILHKKKLTKILQFFWIITSCSSVMIDLRDAIHGFYFTDHSILLNANLSQF